MTARDQEEFTLMQRLATLEYPKGDLSKHQLTILNNLMPYQMDTIKYVAENPPKDQQEKFQLGAPVLLNFYIHYIFTLIHKK